MKQLLMLLVLLMTAGCGAVHETGHPPDVKEILNNDSQADIIQANDEIYQSGIKWVDKTKTTKNEFVMQVNKRTQHVEDFDNGSATQLKSGTKIYSVKERDDILIAVMKDGVVKKYYRQTEG